MSSNEYALPSTEASLYDLRSSTFMVNDCVGLRNSTEYFALRIAQSNAEIAEIIYFFIPHNGMTVNNQAED